MNILMVTNTFTPHVGGVARSVESFSERMRGLGHRVVVAAPYFPDAPRSESDVIRLRAMQNFNGSDFSVPFPITGLLRKTLLSFRPDVVHSHHPFLLGDTALRVAADQNIPIVFTHHTMYERYTHYVPGDSPLLKRFAIDLTTGYCNLCDAVIAPSESVAEVLVSRGVDVPIEVIPTGVDLPFFAAGDGRRFRRDHHIPRDAFVVGHVGRLAPEKNLAFLAQALAVFADRFPKAHVVIVGEGPSRSALETAFAEVGRDHRIVLTGSLQRAQLPDAYAAMDVFAFGSTSETQGMVLTEAMAAGVPAVALDAPGAREVVDDRANGRLLAEQRLEGFVAALRWVASRSRSEREELRKEVSATAERFSIDRGTDQTLALYQRVRNFQSTGQRDVTRSPWAVARRRLAEEWKIFANRAEAAGHALHRPDVPKRSKR